MGFQCVPQSIGLVRELKAGQKNRSVGKPICMESGEERASKSTTIDRTRSHENVFEGYRSGEECWDAMVADADAYRSEYTTKTGKQCSRRLPKQAIIGVQVIVNPPSSVADTWSRETHFKFQKDAAEVLEEIEPRLFRSDNVMMRAHHFDEGKEDCATDTHTVYMAKDENGRYCGSIYDANLRQRMAKEFAEKMRCRGWDIDNPELTDWERYETDAEYKKHIDNKRKKQGKSQPEYNAQQIAERAEKMEQLGIELQVAAGALNDAQTQTQAAIVERDHAILQRDAAIVDRDEAKEQRDAARTERDNWERSRQLIAGESFMRNGKPMLGVEGLERKRDALKKEIEELEKSRDAKRKKLDAREQELDERETAINTSQQALNVSQTAIQQQRSELDKREEELNKRESRIKQLWRRIEARFQAWNMSRERQEAQMRQAVERAATDVIVPIVKTSDVQIKRQLDKRQELLEWLSTDTPTPKREDYGIDL